MKTAKIYTALEFSKISEENKDLVIKDIIESNYSDSDWAHFILDNDGGSHNAILILSGNDNLDFGWSIDRDNYFGEYSIVVTAETLKNNLPDLLKLWGKCEDYDKYEKMVNSIPDSEYSFKYKAETSKCSSYCECEDFYEDEDEESCEEICEAIKELFDTINDDTLKDLKADFEYHVSEENAIECLENDAFYKEYTVED